MARKLPTELVTRKNAESSATFAGRQLNHRARALVAQAYDLLERGRKDAKGRTFVEALADALLAEPIAAAERTVRLTPEAPEPGEAGNQLNIKSLYLMAVQGVQHAAAAAPANLVLEGEYTEAEAPGTSRVQSDASDW